MGQHVQLVTENNWVLYYQAVCRDISDRVAAQEALRDSNTKLRQLSARQEELLETERERIAHDLHDSIGQSLNLARIKLADVCNRNAAHELDGALRDIMQVIDETNGVIRTLEFDLSPPVLRELGLEPALEWLAEHMQQLPGLRVDISSDEEAKPLNLVQRAIVFRAVRELLVNVVRHAGVRTAYVDKRFVHEALRAGAAGYVAKAAASSELPRAIRAVAEGQSYLSPEITATVVGQFTGEGQGAANAPPALSAREREVVRLVSEGVRSAAIARRLGITEATVEVHRRNVMRKRDMRSVAELTKYAVREGLTTL